jgi:hypothetical protein
MVSFSLLAMALTLWKAVKSLSDISGTHFRSREREWQSYTDSLERMLEKAITSSHEQTQLSHVHAMERSARVRASTEMEKTVAPSVPNKDIQLQGEDYLTSPEEVAARFKE